MEIWLIVCTTIYWLGVTDRPGRPEGPLDVVDVYSDRCSLLWDRPKDDGGSPIKHYTVEKNDAAKDTWEEVCTTEDLEIDVTGLKEGHRYQFQVKAVNAQGVSDPLVADGEIIAKDPWGKWPTPSLHVYLSKECLYIFYIYI